MSTRTVAMIAPDFPPSSLPSAIRPRLFANHLAEFGWKPIVIATDPAYYESPVDPDNERLVDASVEVIRTPAIPARWTRKIGLGDLGLRSLWGGYSALRKLREQRKIDLVFVSTPPGAAMLVGRLAWQQYGIPYVLDYQDPLVSDVWWSLPKSQRPPKWALVWALSRAMEPIGVTKASALTGVSMATTDYAASLQAGVPRAEIPFGAEPAEYDFLRRHPRRNPIFDRGDGYFHVTYAGAVVPGMLPAIRSLLEGVARMSQMVKVHFVGTSYASGDSAPRVLPLAELLGMGAIVTEQTRRVPYLDALQISLESSALLVFGSNEAHYTPSKIFSHTLSGVPILAVLHEGSTAARILAEMGSTGVVTYAAEGPGERTPVEVATILERLLLPAEPQSPIQFPEEWTARAMTRRLAEVFDRVMVKAGSA